MSNTNQATARIERWNPILEKLNDIPTLPIVATRVTELINDPNSSSGDIADVLKKDQVLTAKVLKLINSPYYGIPGEVTDVKRALAYLGFNTLAQLVLSVSVISVFAENKNTKFSLQGFWKHALATAVTSEVIAKSTGYPKPEECFTCGLLHDIGKAIDREVAKRLQDPVLAQRWVRVDYQRERDVVEKAAWSVPGVMAVDDRLTV